MADDPHDDDVDLALHARALYPHDPYLQQQWIRAVRLVRTTARGWLLDPPRLPPARVVANDAAAKEPAR